MIRKDKRLRYALVYGAILAIALVQQAAAQSGKVHDMETNPHDLENLLRQLGRGADNIDEFVGAHRLPAGVTLAEAPFSSLGQAAFLAQALADDADWSDAA